MRFMHAINRTSFVNRPLFFVCMSVLCAAVVTMTCGLQSAVADEPRRDTGPVAQGERTPVGRKGGQNGGFPAEIMLTEDQQKKIADLRTTFGPVIAQLEQQRAAILTDEQKKTRIEVDQKIRAEGLGRQSATALLESSVKLSAEQKASLELVERESRNLRAEIEVQRMAVLTDDQRQVLRGIERSRRMERMFQLPEEIKLDDAQKAALKSVQDELYDDLETLDAKKDKVLTPERIAAREKVIMAARDGTMDRQAAAAAIEAAIGLTDAERAELAATESLLRDVRKKIQDRVLALLTPEQKQALENKIGGVLPR